MNIEYNEAPLAKVSEAIQNSLIEGLGIPPDDFFQRNLAPAGIIERESRPAR
jgi:hypothetical protein